MQTKSSPGQKIEAVSPPASSRKPPYLAILVGLVGASFGLIALARVCQIILTVGGNNISNDYLEVVPVINRAFSGQINAANLLSNLTVGQHFAVLPIVFHLLAAYLFDWNARAELLIGVGANLLKTLMIWDLVATGHIKAWRLAIFGAVLALVFSMTQAAVHFFGQACFPVSLSTLGFTVALWGIVRFQGDWRGTILMLVGGIGSALSMGNVPACWCALLLGLFFCGYRAKQWSVYLAWLAGAVISLAPYVFFLSAKSKHSGSLAHSFDWIFFLNMLGRPFSNEVGIQCGRLFMSEFAGTAGLVMLAIALAASFSLQRWSQSAKLSMVLCTYGLVSSIMLSIVRSFVCPWYSAFSIFFWIGLVGVLASALQSNTSGRAGIPPGVGEPPALPGKGAYNAPPRSLLNVGAAFLPPRTMRVACILCLLIIPVFYCLSNRSWEDKHCYLVTRSPASEAGLRNFRHAPTYIESLLFQWGDGRGINVSKLAQPLERYQLSAFAPDQTWALQGDFVLPSVRIFNNDPAHPVRFLEDRTADHPVAWSHYEHANLYVHAPNAVSWTMSLPADMRSARLKTAFTIGIPTKKAKVAITDGVTGKVSVVIGDPMSSTEEEVLAEAHATKAAQWLPIDIDLSRYSGKTITLVFTSDGGKDAADDCAVFQYPTVDARLRRRTQEENRALAERLETHPQPWLPVNTDLSKDFGKTFESAFELPPLSDSSWRNSPETAQIPADIRGDQLGLPTTYSAMRFTAEKSLPVADFNHLLVSMKAPQTFFWRSLKVILLLDTGKQHFFSIPLPMDEKRHACSYDLKLCQLPYDAKVKQIVLYPVAPPATMSWNAITVDNVSFVKEKIPAWCK